MPDFNTFEKDRPEFVKMFNEKRYQNKTGRAPMQVYDNDLTFTERTLVDMLGMKPSANQISNSTGFGTTTFAQDQMTGTIVINSKTDQSIF